MPSGRVKKTVPPVQAEAKLPAAPAYLDALAREQFETLASHLQKDNRLHQTDIKLIEMYGIMYSLLVRAVIELNTEPLNHTSDNGRPYRNPLLGTIDNCTQKLRQIIGDLALSPVTAKLVEGTLPPVDVAGKWKGLV